MSVPARRLRALNDAPIGRGDYVLYWMVAARRTRSSFAIDRAVERARELGVPLLVFEPLRAAYPWASERLSAFVIDGMRDNAERCARAGVAYYPWIEPEAGAGRGLLEALAARASLVVSDEQAGFFQPRMLAAAAARLPVRLEAVDGVGLLPVRATEGAFARAVDFRRFLQKALPAELAALPARDPLRAARGLPKLARLPPGVTERWGRPALETPSDPARLRGGANAAAARLADFIDHKLPRYEERRHPDLDAGSGLSPYLHFGHVGVHEIWQALVEREGWTPEALSPRSAGQKEGFWGKSAQAEAFLDELVTWRELGHNFCAHRADFDQYESLPSWARATLEKHARDPRPRIYSREELERAETHDPVWNAAQRELLQTGLMHNYLRMLWGKKILEWSPSPRDALSTLIELNNKYALDGRDPNSYSGIFWCLGRYDRPWAPERPIFGCVRYMSSDATLKKLRMKRYLARYGTP
ncbi:MAG: deoxyribodipyrimidine photolyase [Myxococcales bacterium]|nr:deoxyribodipyrimidine photolyase [Myxococcales bacterium]